MSHLELRSFPRLCFLSRYSLRWIPLVRCCRSSAVCANDVLRLTHGSVFCNSSASYPASSVRMRQRHKIHDGPDLQHFISEVNRARMKKIDPMIEETKAYVQSSDYSGNGLSVCFITYGCQMNINDVELVRALLLSNGYIETRDHKKADVVLLMTCSVREGAENKIWNELKSLKAERKEKGVTGILGCMAERVRHDLLTHAQNVNVVAGPDAYRDLPRLLAIARHGTKAINVQLSLDETYADIAPVRSDENSTTAFVSIMRGCDNMCTYCVVPYTRGRERSRPMETVLDEVRQLSNKGVKQVTLLGQNVNSYRDFSLASFPSTCIPYPGTAPGFKTKYRPKKGGRTFLELLDRVSQVDPEMRIRFTSPHPKDFPIELIQLISERPNICNHIHLPAQSGSNEVLKAMDRGYTRESYLDLVNRMRDIIPNISLTSDFIAGFCGETEQAHQETLSLIHQVMYTFCYVFPYSSREKTKAYHHLVDDVPLEVKKRRHLELAETFREGATKQNRKLIGTTHLVLLEETSKRSVEDLRGWTDGGISTIVKKHFPDENVELKPGDYVAVKITAANSQTLHGHVMQRITLSDFAKLRQHERRQS